MRLPQNVILGIYGRSCTGKTTVAKVLAETLACPVRYCGELVRAAAKQTGLDVDNLPDDSHRQIDEQTCTWAFTPRSSSIVEGRYLDYVLSPGATTLCLVRLEASLETRLLRWQEKTDTMCSVTDFTRLDSTEDAFRFRLYQRRRPLMPSTTIDTTYSTPDEIAQCLIRMAQTEMNGRD